MFGNTPPEIEVSSNDTVYSILNDHRFFDALGIEISFLDIENGGSGSRIMYSPINSSRKSVSYFTCSFDSKSLYLFNFSSSSDTITPGQVIYYEISSGGGSN